MGTTTVFVDCDFVVGQALIAPTITSSEKTLDLLFVTPRQANLSEADSKIKLSTEE